MQAYRLFETEKQVEPSFVKFVFDFIETQLIMDEGVVNGLSYSSLLKM